MVLKSLPMMQSLHENIKKTALLLMGILCVCSAFAQYKDQSYLKKDQPVPNEYRTQFIPDSKYGAVVSQYNLTEALKNPELYKSARFYGAGLKQFPEELFLFKYLEEIDLSANELTELPLKINEFKYLKEVHVNKNKLTTLGPEITLCSQLQVLQIQDNPLKTISKDLGKMHSLLEITIGEIAPECVVPVELWSLTGLKKIKITNANLTEIPSTIGKFSGLEVFCLTHNAIASIPEELYTIKTLTYLNLGYNNINVVSPSVANLENLDYLGVFYNPLHSLPKEITHLTKLSFISCWKTKIPQKEIEALRIKLPNTGIHNTETDLR